jgi:hypothetical protein
MTAPLPRRKHPRLTFLERRWLISGKPYAVPFLDGGKWAKRLWKEFGSVVTERYTRRFLFSRPHGWWRYDRGHDPRQPGESEFDYLIRHPRLLTTREKQRLRAQSQRLDRLADVGAR